MVLFVFTFILAAQGIFCAENLDGQGVETGNPKALLPVCLQDIKPPEVCASKQMAIAKNARALAMRSGYPRPFRLVKDEVLRCVGPKVTPVRFPGAVCDENCIKCLQRQCANRIGQAF